MSSPETPANPFEVKPYVSQADPLDTVYGQFLFFDGMIRDFRCYSHLPQHLRGDRCGYDEWLERHFDNDHAGFLGYFNLPESHHTADDWFGQVLFAARMEETAPSGPDGEYSERMIVLRADYFAMMDSEIAFLRELDRVVTDLPSGDAPDNGDGE